MTKGLESANKKEETENEVEQELSKVASNPKKNIAILAGIAMLFTYIFFTMFMGSDTSKNKKPDTPMPAEVTKPIEVSTDNDIPSIPTLPSPPKLEDPTPPPPPAVKSDKTANDAVLPPLPLTDQADAASKTATEPVIPILPSTTQNSEAEKKRKDAKRKSSIILVAGTPPAKTPEQIEQETDFKYRGDMNLILGRGKLIDAIVENAVNTDFGGEIRAVITRDIYSEWGKNILIPKGSRVFGAYTSGISGGYGRINIEWNRIDLANGYTINLSGTATDHLGRKGIEGRVDNKFRERFSNAVLRSAFNVALADTLDSLVKPQATSQQAAAQSSTASSIRNIAIEINNQTSIPPGQRREQICSSVLGAIQDKTSGAFTSVSAACDSLRTQIGATDDQKLTSLVSTVNSAADTLLQVNNTNVQESKAQQASKQAFTDISDTVKGFIEEHEFKPTITVNQGTHIKIYVNKDFKFPKAAINKSKVLR